MKVLGTTNGAIAALTTGSDLCTVARAKLIPITGSSPKPANELLVYQNETAEGEQFTPLTRVLAGNSFPTVNLNPSFYPVATQGSECAAIVSSLKWADNNLAKGYEYLHLIEDAVPANNRYFVSGVLNSSQTLANDPFVKPEVVVAHCWNMNYADGVFVI